MTSEPAKKEGITPLKRAKGVFVNGLWGDAQGQPVSSFKPGETVQLRVKLVRVKAEPAEGDLKFDVYAFHQNPKNLKKLFTLPDDGGEVTLETSGEEGRAKVEWETPKTPPQGKEWPSALTFRPKLDGWKRGGGKKGRRPWQAPLISVVDAWEVKTWWAPPTAEPGMMVTLNTKVYGLNPDDAKVKFKVKYKVGNSHHPLEKGEGWEKSPPSVDAKQKGKLEPDDEGNVLGTAEWTVPGPTQLGELRKKHDEEEPPPPSPEMVFKQSKCHTLILKMTATDTDDEIEGPTELNVEEAPYIHSF